MDLTKLYFTPEERPGGYIYQGVGTGLPRNPMPAKEPGEVDTLIKLLVANVKLRPARTALTALAVVASSCVVVWVVGGFADFLQDDRFFAFDFFRREVGSEDQAESYVQHLRCIG